MVSTTTSSRAACLLAVLGFAIASVSTERRDGWAVLPMPRGSMQQQVQESPFSRRLLVASARPRQDRGPPEYVGAGRDELDNSFSAFSLFGPILKKVSWRMYSQKRWCESLGKPCGFAGPNQGLDPQSRWKKKDRRVLRLAMEYILDTFGSTFGVIQQEDCVQRHASKYESVFGVHPSHKREVAWKDLRALMSGGDQGEWPQLNIYAAHEKDRLWSGRARVARWLWGTSAGALDWFRGPAGAQQPAMEINLWWLRETLKRFGEKETAEVLAGTLLHETLHQMGHSHGRTVYEYCGTFITMAGDCLAYRGERVRMVCMPSDISVDNINNRAWAKFLNPDVIY